MFEGLIPDERLLCLDLNEAFPPIGDDIDIVFDLAGSISANAISITSAIKQSDVVIVPIYNEVKAIKAGLNTIAEVMALNQNIIVVATKLQKRGKSDIFTDWSQSEDCRNITDAVAKVSAEIPVLPLKYSTVFDTIFEQEKSVRQLMQSS